MVALMRQLLFKGDRFVQKKSVFFAFRLRQKTISAPPLSIVTAGSDFSPVRVFFTLSASHIPDEHDAFAI